MFKMKRRKKIEDPITKNINIIQKKGDLYDVISKKRNGGHRDVRMDQNQNKGFL